MINLDKYQRNAAFCNDKKALVVAPPGSGKTTVIINRLEYLIREMNIRPQNIVVITFTKAAANNMRERFKNLYKGISYPFFGTFHGLFYKILKRERGNLKLIVGNEAYKLVRNFLNNKLDEISDEKVKEMLNMISYYKSRGQFKEGNFDKDLFYECYREYESYKDKNELLDFDDLQIECKNLFLSDPNVLKNYKNLFKHILVDEFQDCDPTQIEILQLFDESNLFSVGDEDQCIYSFRGSEPRCMVEFEKFFLGGKKKYLKYNYRSSKNIVDASIKAIENNNQRNKKQIKAFKDQKGTFEILTPYNESIQVEDISKKIETEKNKGISYKENAVLYRTNMQSRSIIDGFIRNKIPFKLLDGEYNFYEHFICKDLAAYLNLSIDPTDKESFFRVINKPFRYVSKNILEEMKKNPYKENLFEKLKENKNIHPYQVKNIDKLYKDICSLNKMSLGVAINFILNDLDYRNYLIDYSNKYKQNFDELEDVVNEFRSSSLDFSSIIKFLVHIEFIGDKLKESKNLERDAVLLSTIHGVKGMEFQNVFLIEANEDILPHKNSNEENNEEERRIFYVALTRAIKNLYVYAPKNLKGSFKEKSVFLKETEFEEFFLEKNYGFKIGQEITHKSFGVGKIIDLNKKEIEILFKEGIKRRFSLEVLIENRLID